MWPSDGLPIDDRYSIHTSNESVPAMKFKVTDVEYQRMVELKTDCRFLDPCKLKDCKQLTWRFKGKFFGV